MSPDAARSAHDHALLEDHWTPRIRVIGWTTALSLGALQAWAGRFPVGEDGVSYLDIADAYLRGDWQHAINAYWSPVYSLLQAAGFAIVRPTPFLESTVVHSVNLLIYLGALAALEFFLRQLAAVHRQRDPGDVDMRMPLNALLALGYGLFVWAMTQWITVSIETPDICLAAVILIAMGLLLRMRTQPATTATFLGFGAILGLGYLTKSVMLPLSFMFWALLYLTIENRSAAIRGLATAVAAFAVVAAPYMAAVSIAKGRFTTGDTGKLAYIWHANEALDRERHWHAEFPDDMRPVHPTRKVLDRPAVYEFGSDPVGGTYPVWYDPSYWHEGVPVRFDLRGQLRTLHWSSLVWRRVFLADGDFLILAGLILLVAGFRGWDRLWRDLRGTAVLLLPLIVAVVLYSMVLLSPRYIAVFVVLFWLGVFSMVRLPRWPGGHRVFWGAASAVLLIVALRLAPWAAERAREARQQLNPANHFYWQIAEGLHQLGAREGDTVMQAGYGAPVYWARLARLRIVADIFGEDLGFSLVPGIEKIVQSDGSLTPDAVRVFRQTGAKFLIARHLTKSTAQGWHELGTSNWWAYPLSQ